MMFNSIVDATTGLPMVCDTEGCGQAASFVWYGGWDNKPMRCCEQHNPMRLPGPLPTGFHGSSICHACGQPVSFGGLTG